MSYGSSIYKLMNNKLPPYFENMKPVLPRVCDNYDIRRPYFHLPLIKHNFVEQLLSYQLTTMLNENNSTRFSSKVFIHTFLQWFQILFLKCYYRWIYNKLQRNKLCLNFSSERVAN